MKKINYLLAIIAIVATLIACNSKVKEARQELRQDVEAFNQNCPVDFNYGQITEVLFNEDADAIQYIIAYNDSIFPSEVLHSKAEFIRSSIIMMISLRKETFQQIVDAEMALDYIYRSEITDEETVFHFSVDDIRDAISNPMSDEELYQTILSNDILNEKSECPTFLDEGLFMTDVYEDGDNVVFVYSMDEDIYDMELMQSLADDLKAGIVEALKGDSSTQTLVDAVKYLDKNIIYKYVGTPSGTTFEFLVEPDDL